MLNLKKKCLCTEEMDRNDDGGDGDGSDDYWG